MPVLVGAVMTSILFSYVSGINFVDPELRFSFYVVAGVTSGVWLLARRSIRSPAVRIALAGLAAVEAMSVVGRSADQPLGGPVLPIVSGMLLILGIVGWFSFLRHVEDEARCRGWWRALRRPPS